VLDVVLEVLDEVPEVLDALVPLASVRSGTVTSVPAPVDDAPAVDGADVPAEVAGPAVVQPASSTSATPMTSTGPPARLFDNVMFPLAMLLQVCRLGTAVGSPRTDPGGCRHPFVTFEPA